MTTTITGLDAINYATATGATLRKHADPIDGAREVSVDEAREIAREDASLIYCEARAVSITIEISRNTIDPQGIGSDEDFAAARESILDALRAEWPDAEINAVGNGGRTSGIDGDGADITHDVKRVASEALNSMF